MAIVLTAEILSIRSEEDADFVTFQFVFDDGSIEGPRGMFRPSKDDHQIFIDEQIPAMNESREEVPEEESLLKLVLQHSDDAIKAVFKLDDAELAALKEAK